MRYLRQHSQATSQQQPEIGEVLMDVQPHLLNLSAYINQNLEKDLPLSSLAKRVGLSPFHFHRKFGAYFGESLHQHIKRLRLERAAYALLHGSTPVRQIARDSGYKTVSAFSHAFSGFAGESPTRYRSLGNGNGNGTGNGNGKRPADLSDENKVDAVQPAWLGEIQPQEIAFVRAKGSGRGAQRSVRDGIEMIRSLAGPLMAPVDDQAGDQNGNTALEFVGVTSDVYGISNSGDFRIDVGLDAKRIAPERLNSLGVQTLPGGRYARFDFKSQPMDIIENCLRATMFGLNGQGETPRLAQYFLRFNVDDRSDPTQDGLRDYQFFVPLTG
jgi:AraC-like DNA-binding protein